jgi:HD-GYP domain-containing protein (c-di-GMP phosphodiesterase class II)
MKQLRLNNYRPPIKARMREVIEATGYDILRVVWVDNNMKTINISESAGELSGDYCEYFTYPRLERIIKLMTTTKEAYILEEPEEEFNGLAYGKLNSQMAQEVYFPFFDYRVELAGFIYLSRLKPPEADIFNDQRITDKIIQLVYSVETNITRYRLNRNLYDAALFMCELSNIKQPYMLGYIYTISFWAVRIAKQLGVSQKDISLLQLAILMHDLGKLQYDDGIPDFKVSFTEEEQEKIKKRIIYSYQITQKICQIFGVTGIPDIVLNYRERVDGKGYPYGVSGDKIPLLSKIIYVAKAITFMLENTPSRRASSHDEIIKLLKSRTKSHFDKEVVNAAVELLVYDKDEYTDYFNGIGSYGTLSIYTGNSEVTSINIWGNIRQAKFQYVFTPVEKMPSLLLSDIKKVNLYLNINEQFIRFKLKIEDIQPSIILISSIERINDDKTFAVKWLLEGRIKTRNKQIYKLFVNLVGGEFLDFYIFKNELAEPVTAGTVYIIFNNRDEVILPGIVVFRQEIDDKVFFRFRYTNLTEINERRLFAGMFRKQAEMRNLVAEHELAE